MKKKSLATINKIFIIKKNYAYDNIIIYSDNDKLLSGINMKLIKAHLIALCQQNFFIY